MYPGVKLAKCVHKEKSNMPCVSLTCPNRRIASGFVWIYFTCPSEECLENIWKRGRQHSQSFKTNTLQLTLLSHSSWAVRFIIDSLAKAVCWNSGCAVAAISRHCVLHCLTDLLLKPSVVKMNHVSHLYRNCFIIIILIRKSYLITAKTAVTAAITLFREYQPLFTPINSFFSQNCSSALSLTYCLPCYS